MSVGAFENPMLDPADEDNVGYLTREAPEFDETPWTALEAHPIGWKSPEAKAKRATKRAKNHLLLVEAFAKAVAEEPRLRLILAGDGSLRKKAERRVRQLGLKDKVDFLGWRSDIPILLKDCDIFVLSSDWEGFGNVLVEAMSAGKPIVATRVGGVPEVVEDGVTGFLVPPRDADVFASAILKLVREKRLREEMGRKGREKAVKEFDISIVTREYERLYKEALNRQR